MARAACEPDAASGLHGVDEILEQPHTGGPPTEPGMQGECEATPEIMHGFELPPPEIIDLGAILGDESPGRIGVEGKLLPVLEQPLPRNLDQPVGMRVRHVVAHLARAIAHAVPHEQAGCPWIGLKPWGAIAGRADAGDLCKQIDAAREDFLFLVLLEEGKLLVQVPVKTDLMSARDDRFDHPRMMFGDVARDEKSRRRFEMSEQSEQAGHSDPRPVLALRHQRPPPGQLRVFAQGRRLAIDVEAQHRRAAIFAGPHKPRRRHEWGVAIRLHRQPP